jgi:gentisate 1,2-dioxygenase
MKDLKEFSSELKKKNLAGYWETSEGEVYREPVSSFEPCLWKWKDVQNAIVQAGEVVGLETVSIIEESSVCAVPRKAQRRTLFSSIFKCFSPANTPSPIAILKRVCVSSLRARELAV